MFNLEEGLRSEEEVFEHQESKNDFSKIDSIIVALCSNITSVLGYKKSDIVEVKILEILEKICVRPPYFAFENIYSYGEILLSKVPVQQKLGIEFEPISSAEASRHLAILGSCVLGINEKERMFYLAHKAIMSSGKYFTLSKEERSSNIYAIAIPQNSLKMEASAKTILVDENFTVLFDFDITFQKMSKRLFSRIFHNHLQETMSYDYNPYESSHLVKLKDVSIKGNVMTGKLPIVKPEYCAGHFDEAPMLPVGILSYVIIWSVGEFLIEITKNSNIKTYLANAEMELFAPTCSLDREEIVEITYNGKEIDKYNFSWITKDNVGTVINTMRISFVVAGK